VSSGRPSTEHGAVERVGDKFRVRLLKTSGRTLTSRDRFTIAHELAHIMFLQHDVELPVGREEYWKLEEECNFVAGRLLVPRWLAPREPIEPTGVGSWLSALSRRAGLSLAAASKELILSSPNGIATVGLVEKRPGVLLVTWSHSRDDLVAVPAARAHVASSTWLGHLFAKARDSSGSATEQLDSTSVASAFAIGETVSICILQPLNSSGQMSLLDGPPSQFVP
jgi:hypothetical protein